MFLSYGVENIRRLGAFPEIEMRPITILVGRNSAGKSTFLRSLPLIRQSLETRSSAPILWFGDLVDFGDLNTAIGEGEDARQAAFKFTVRDLSGQSRSTFVYIDDFHLNRHDVHVDLLSLRYIIGARDDKTILQSIEIKTPSENIEVCFDFGSRQGSLGEITINGSAADFVSKTYGISVVDRNLFAPPIFTLRSSEKEGLARRILRPRGVLAVTLMNTFRRRVTRPISDATLRSEARRVLTQNRFDKDTITRLMHNASTVTFYRIYEHLLSSRNSEFKDQVFAIQRLARVYTVLEILEEKLTDYFLDVAYLEPVRAASERFYRKQELEVSEIVPHGSNFPMFLASLTMRDLERFSSPTYSARAGFVG